MKIKLANSLGYCMGVRRAMDMAFRHLSQRGEKVFSHGELIHNNSALELLSAKGLKIWQGEDEGTIIIRAHGLPPDELEKLSRTSLKISNATCPKVLAVQKLVADEAEKGRDVIIWGGANHPEVIGIVGHARGRGHVVKDAAAVNDLPPLNDPVLVSQTTQDLERWPEIEAAVLARWPQAKIRKTICLATFKRQTDVHRLAEEMDALLIIGGNTSGNTARLADIGRRKGLKTFLVETVDDLKNADFQGIETLGVAAGASTSNWQIGQILEAIRTQTRPHGGFFSRLLRALVLSNIYAALGLAALSQCVTIIMGLPLAPHIFSFFFFQVVAIHLFRDFTKGQTIKFNDPDRQYFMDKYRRPLMILGSLSLLLASIGAALEGPRLSLLMALMWLSIIIYQFTPRPKGYENWQIVRLLLKPALLALAWGATFVWAAAPLFEIMESKNTAIISIIAVSGHIFLLSAMEHVRGAQGDQIFGRPSLALILGEKKTETALVVFTVLWGLALLSSLHANPSSHMVTLMFFSGPVYSMCLMKQIFRNPYGYMFEAAMYGQLLINLIWVSLWAL